MTDQPIPPPEHQPDPPIPTDGKPPVDISAFAKYFTDGAFWQKVKDFAAKLGRGTLQKALELYNVAMSKDTPVLAKAIALGSLGYLIMPIDAIPDVIPGLGLSDDAAALTAAAVAVLKNITPAIRARAAEQVGKWFGPDPNAAAAPTPAAPEPPPVPPTDVPSPS